MSRTFSPFHAKRFPAPGEGELAFGHSELLIIQRKIARTGEMDLLRADLDRQGCALGEALSPDSWRCERLSLHRQFTLVGWVLRHWTIAASLDAPQLHDGPHPGPGQPQDISVFAFAAKREVGGTPLADTDEPSKIQCGNKKRAKPYFTRITRSSQTALMSLEPATYAGPVTLSDR